MHAGQPRVGGHRLRVREVGVGLAGEANDHIGGQCDVGGMRSQGGDQVEVVATPVEATHALEYAVAAGLQWDVKVPAESRRRGQLDQLGGEVVGIDGAETKPCRGDRRQQPPNERCEGVAAVAAEGAQVDAGQHDLAIAIGDRLLRALDQCGLVLALRHAAGAPHDAVGAAVIAAVLHFEEESRARERRRSAGARGRRERRGQVIEDLSFPVVGECDIDARNRGYARVRIVDVAPRQDQLRLRVAAT